MKGKSTVAIIIAILLVAIGATFYFIMNFFENNPTQTQPIGYTTGIIIDTEDSGILVVGDLTEEEATQLTVEEAIEAGTNATWFRISMAQRNDFELYDLVKVGYESLQESHPASGEAKTIEKLDE
ncbi:MULTISPECIES: DUF3221 domain-containing protein [Psychrobacillus]|jgi:hypothetical protein|uniref:DUF3221 domain-containing protein n=2 Tax=Bacillales TaxID=1385 RepID=A0ABR8RC31_9BACI|nr:DUF3221 domain-containing protein [Psychrobacillus faecigallinarum]MBD7945299.1 DUF3221 domain-containing protein [Psychrobacillus faecigallinarum]QGM32289.1 hypothetical protein GI482_18865 [Bacillus sp. N3536]